MKIKIESDRIYVTVPGHSWSNGIKAPEIEGWEPFWVSHIGSERTEYVYRPVEPAIEDQALDLARYNPPHAIRGWLAGYEANADQLNAAICERALQIQESWKTPEPQSIAARHDEVFGEDDDDRAYERSVEE